MLKDVRNKTLEVGDVVFLIENKVTGIVQEVTPPITVPGGPPQGIQKVRLLAVLELPPVPAGAMFTNLATLDKNDTEAAKTALEMLIKCVEEMRVGSGSSTLLVR